MGEHTENSLSRTAAFFGKSEKTIRNWIRRGCPAKVGGPNSVGEYDLAAMLAWAMEHVWVERQNAGPESGEGPSKTDLEKEKLAVEIAQKELALQEKSGKLVDRAEAIAAASRVAAVVRSRLEAIPGEVASTVPPEMRADVIADWGHKVRLALKELSEMEFTG